MHRPRRLSGLLENPATVVIVAVNIAIFAFQTLAGPSGDFLFETFELTRRGLRSGEIWQLVTYQFLHGNTMHLFVNMLGLWFAGRELERVVGSRRFVALYLAGGVAGGLAQMIFSSSGGALVGASGSVCAVLLALTTLFPRLPITALIFFVLPVRMRARTLGIGLVAGSVLFWLSGLQPEVGHLAHLGGFAAGAAFGWAFRAQFGEAGGSFLRKNTQPPPLPGEVAYLRPLPSMDEILAKVLRDGIDSLTREERRILAEDRRPRR